MLNLYLTPASITYLNQFLLSLLISLYLIQRVFAVRHARPSRQDTLLVVFFGLVTVFSLTMSLEVSWLPSERLLAVYLENPILGLMLVVLIQFAYLIPGAQWTNKYERGLALLVSSLYALVEAGYAIWRFGLLGHGQVEFRPELMDYPLVAEFLWVVIIFGRGALHRQNNRASRRFALVFVIPFLLAIINLLRTLDMVSTPFYHISLSVGILFTMYLFALNYLGAKPDTTPLAVRLSGTVITSALAILGIVAWLVTPAYAAQYRPAIQGERTLHFAPNALGGYDISEIPFHFDSDLGQALALNDLSINHISTQRVDFEFQFYGKTYQQLFISDDGALSFGAAINYKDLEYHFSGQPAILALVLDLDPRANPDGGIYTRKDGQGGLLVTYFRLSSFSHPENRYTFQIHLHTGGSFEISHAELPQNQQYFVNDRPQAGIWAVGVKPGPGKSPSIASLANLPLQSGPQGIVQDEHLAFMAYLDSFLRPLAILILSAGALLLIGLPLMMNVLLTRPLKTLISGIDLFNQGNLEHSIDIQSNDEIGFLTRAFNGMSSQLGSLLKELEARVTERTAELLAANDQLSKLSIAVEQSPSSIVITDLDANIEYVNPAFTHSTGYSFEEVCGKNPRILKTEQTSPETYQDMWNSLLAGKTWRGELLNRKKSGETFWENTLIAPIHDEKGKITHYVAVKDDISERKHTEQLLRESEKQYRDLFEMESDAIFIVNNADNRILEANSAASTLYGFSHEELINKKNTDLSAEPEKTQQATKSPAPVNRTIHIALRWHRKKDGTVFPVEITARFITWKDQEVHIAAIRDVTERHQAEKELERLAITDALTGLFNRGHFFVEAEKIFARSQHPPCDLSVLMLDLDLFKHVNDTYGHHVGDVVLHEVTRRLSENLRPTDLFARYGGEEFVILLPRTPCADVPAIAERLVGSVNSSPVRVNGMEISVTISMGVAQRTEKVASLYELLSRSDLAMYQAKEAGRNRWVEFEEG